ncbi:hypothetical protein CHS0354_034128 [Potamilus streckersoni]|uniref:Ig-like domain-containing protein n=1 Tax=Potamilus streckersoni TaxID=2493646 RepID=A0AAE0TDE6_9BIVA|nr:hypothetical protein CHS0354_034128 [Potamilus streckersoni]
MKFLLLAVLCTYQIRDTVLAKRGFVLIFPQELQIGADEKFCLSFFNVTSDVSINLTLKCHGQDLTSWRADTIKSGRDDCILWSIPDELTSGNCDVSIDGHADAISYSFNGSRSTRLVDTAQITFIQTDKPVYKPGQIVKFRILITNQDLKPLSSQLSSVMIKDPNNIHMKEWKSLQGKSGLVSLEYPLCSEPVIGKWTIGVTVNNRKTEQEFEIQKYVLPKFQVKLKLPTVLTVATLNTDLEVCARYTYGKPVQGRLKAKICLKNQEKNWYCRKDDRPCVEIDLKIMGCHKFTVATKHLMIKERMYTVLCKPRLVLAANVTEDVTGITVSVEEKGPSLSEERVKLRFLSKEYFKPYLPYYGQVQVSHMDDNPIPGEKVEIKVQKLGLRQILTADDQGVVYFTITNLTRDTPYFIISADTLDKEEYDRDFYTVLPAHTGLTVKQWYSPNSSYLEVETVNLSPLKCSGEVELSIMYTSQLSEKTMPHKLYYMVMGRGNILGTHDITNQLSSKATYVPEIRGTLLEPQPQDTTPSPTEAPQDKQETLSPVEDIEEGVQGPAGWNSIPGSPGFRMAYAYQHRKKRASSLTTALTIDGKDLVILGKMIDLKCSVKTTGDKPEPIDWFFQDELIDISLEKWKSRVLINNTNPSATQLESTLSINGATEEDTGLFVCRSGIFIDVLQVTVGEESADDKKEEEEIEEEKEKESHREYKRLIIQFPVIPEMSPTGRVLVYYITNVGEMVAGFVDFKVEPCFGNKVKMQYEQNITHPGSNVNLTISASPGSLCAIGVVDQSVHLFSRNNLLQWADMMDIMESYDLTSNHISNRDYCLDQKDKSTLLHLPVPVGPPGIEELSDIGLNPFLGRKKRSIMQFYSEYLDSLLAFKRSGLVAVTDLDLETRPCSGKNGIDAPDYSILADVAGPPGLSSAIPGPVYTGNFCSFSSDYPTDDDDSSAIKSLRDYFPETWLWDLEEIPASGNLLLNRIIPDTITTWVGNTLCTSPSEGVGLSLSANITSFQPFFLSFNLPYSVVRGEAVTLDVSIFNYKDQCSMVELDLKQSEEFELLEVPDGSTLTVVCLCQEAAASHRFTIRPKVMGSINITVTGLMREMRSTCDTRSVGVRITPVAPVTDTITRQLLVEAEGVEEEKTQSFYLCPHDKDSLKDVTITPEIQDDFLVEDSVRGWISVIGDLMGPALFGLDRLIEIPIGCGEQNMIKFMPNVVILNYLKATHQLTDALRKKAISNLEKGYQQQMNFVLDDGSFSAFGKSDKKGSTWLSGFIFKSFQQAMQHISVDYDDVQYKLWHFLWSKQGHDGCFREDGKILTKYMQGGVAGDKTNKALTAFILAAMMESFAIMRNRAPPFVSRAVHCLDVSNLNDTYTLAITAYALSLYSPNSNTTLSLLHRLLNEVRVEDGLMHWERHKKPDVWFDQGTRAPSAEVEMTAYALMAFLHSNSLLTTKELIPIVRWLTQQRNAYGGFSSTQDSMVALQALAEFAEHVYGDSLNVSVEVKDVSQTFKETFSITQQNNLILQKQVLPNPMSALEVKAMGTGCVVLQSLIRYNTLSKKLPDTAFTLEVTTPVTEMVVMNCRSRILKICTSYTGPGGSSNMALIEVKMLSGWIPDVNSLQKLLKNEEIGLKKYELDERHPDIVNFYFEKFDRNILCFAFNILLEVEVKNQQAAMARVFDYYETDLRMTSFYELSACTKDHMTNDNVMIYKVIQEGKHAEETPIIGKVSDPDVFIDSSPFSREDLINIDDADEEMKSTPTDEEALSKTSQSCPKCIPTGEVNIFDKLCTKEFLELENLGEESILTSISKPGLTQRIKLPPELMQCPNCKMLLGQKGSKSLVLRDSVPLTSQQQMYTQSETNTMMIPWAEILVESLKLSYSRCI